MIIPNIPKYHYINSKKHLLCKSCSSGYYPIVNSDAGDRKTVTRIYKDCYNRDTIPSNYFLLLNFY